MQVGYDALKQLIWAKYKALNEDFGCQLSDDFSRQNDD